MRDIHLRTHDAFIKGGQYCLDKEKTMNNLPLTKLVTDITFTALIHLKPIIVFDEIRVIKHITVNGGEGKIEPLLFYLNNSMLAIRLTVYSWVFQGTRQAQGLFLYNEHSGIYPRWTELEDEEYEDIITTWTTFAQLEEAWPEEKIR